MQNNSKQNKLKTSSLHSMIYANLPVSIKLLVSEFSDILRDDDIDNISIPCLVQGLTQVAKTDQATATAIVMKLFLLLGEINSDDPDRLATVLFLMQTILQVVTLSYPLVIVKGSPDHVFSNYGTNKLRSYISSATIRRNPFLIKLAANWSRENVQICVAILQKFMSIEFAMYEYLSLMGRENLSYLPQETTERIDILGGNLMAFLSFSSPEAYFQIVTSKLRDLEKVAANGISTSKLDDSDLLEFLKAALALEFLTLGFTPEDHETQARQSFDFTLWFLQLPCKDTLCKQIVFINVMKSIKHWVAHCQPNYVQLTSSVDKPIPQMAHALFLEAVKILDHGHGHYDLVHKKIFARFLAFLICLNPSSFVFANDQDPAAKFLTTITKAATKGPISSKVYVDACDCFVLLQGMAATVFQFLPNHVVVLFARKYDRHFLPVLSEHKVLSDEFPLAGLRICFFCFHSAFDDSDFDLSLDAGLDPHSLDRLLTVACGVKLLYDKQGAQNVIYSKRFTSVIYSYLPKLIGLIKYCPSQTAIAPELKYKSRSFKLKLRRGNSSSTSSSSTGDDLEHLTEHHETALTSKKIISNFATIIRLANHVYLDLQKPEFNQFSDSPYAFSDILSATIVCGLEDDNEEFNSASRQLLQCSTDIRQYSLQFDLCDKIDHANYISVNVLQSFCLDDPKLLAITSLVADSYHINLTAALQHPLHVIPTLDYPGFLTKQIYYLELILYYLLCLNDFSILKPLIRMVDDGIRKMSLMLEMIGPDIRAGIESALRYFRVIVPEDSQVTGMVAFRKRIRKTLLSYIHHPTKGLYDSWVGLFGQWKKIDRASKIYGNISSHLAMSIGVFLNVGELSKDILEFMDEQVNSLVARDYPLRTLAKNIIKDELHPRALGYMFLKLEEFFLERPVTDNVDSGYLNAIFTALELLEKMLSEVDRLVLFDIWLNIFSICDAIIKIIPILDSIAKLQTRAKMCLVATAFYKSDVHFISMKLRNEYYNLIVLWMTEVFDLSDSLTVSSVQKSSESWVSFNSRSSNAQVRLSDERLNFHCQGSVALCYLTAQLTLIPASGTDKQKMFDLFTSMIIDVLSRYAKPELTKRISVDTRKVKIEQICNNLTKSLGNLYACNVDLTAEMSVALGYLEEPNIRLVCYKIFNSISETRPTDTKEEYLLNFVDLIVQNELFSVALAKVCPKTEKDHLGSALLEVYGSKGKSLEILLQMVIWEIRTGSETVLRHNNVVSRVLYEFTQCAEGTEYLQLVFSKKFQLIAKENKPYGLDSTGENDSTVFTNYLASIIDSIYHSASLLPPSFRYICFKIRQECQASTSHNPLVIVGAFIFLRFICPAFVNPYKDILPEQVLTSQEKKTFVTLAKVLQAMANQLSAISQSPILENQKPIVFPLYGKIMRFLDMISKPIAVTPPKIVTLTSNNAVNYLHMFLNSHSLEIANYYLAAKTDGESLELKYNLYAQLFDTLTKLGNPKMPGTTETMGSRALEVTIHDPISALDPVFLTRNTCSSGIPLILFSYFKFQNLQVFSAISKHIAKQELSSLKDEKFLIILDATEYKTQKLHHDFVSCFLSVDNLESVYVVNANRQFLNDHPEFPESVNFLTTISEAKVLSRYAILTHVCDLLTEELLAFQINVLDTELVPGKLYFGDNHVQIAFKKDGKDLNEVYFIRSLKIFISSHTDYQGELTLHDKYTNTQLTIFSAESQEILQIFNQNFSGGCKKDTRERRNSIGHAIVNENYIGELILLSFAGILSRDWQIQQEAHKLMLHLDSSNHYFLTCLIQINELPEDNYWLVCQASRQLAVQRPELTQQIFQGFFKLLNSFALADKPKFVSVISPWIVNIHSHVYMLGLDSSWVATRELIAKLIELAKGPLLGVFKREVFSRLMAFDDLVEILVEELVGHIKHHLYPAQKSWKQVTQLLTSTCTPKLCSYLIKRLVQISYDGGENLAEIALLLKMTLHSFMDSKHYCQKFLPDLLYVIFVYHNYGKKDMKREVYHLACKVFELTSQDPELLQYFEADTTKLTFGLFNLDSATQRQNVGDLLRMENLCDRLLRLLYSNAPRACKIVWKERWWAHALKLTLESTSVFQPRGVILFGTIAKAHLPYNLLLKMIVKSTTYQLENKHGLLVFGDSDVYTLYSYGMCSQGMPDNLQFLLEGIWGYVCRCLNNDTVMYEVSLYGMGNYAVVLTANIEDVSADMLYRVRGRFEASLAQLEASAGFVITSENCEIFFCYVFSKGLYGNVKVDIVLSLQRFILMVRRLQLDISSYLLLLFVISDSQQFWKFVNEQIGDAFVELDYNIQVPQTVISYVLLESDGLLALLSILANYFKSAKIQEQTRLKILVILKHVAHNNVPTLVRFYSAIIDMIEFIRNDPQTNPDFTSLTTAILVKMSQFTDPKLESHTELAATLAAFGVQGIATPTFLSPKDKNFNRIMRQHKQLVTNTLIAFLDEPPY